MVQRRKTQRAARKIRRSRYQHARRKQGLTALAEMQTQMSKERTVLAEEQTILSKERTVLSFMQTGLAFIGAGIVVVNFLIDASLHAVGWLLIIIGFIEVIDSYRRLTRYKKKMEGVKKGLGRHV